MRRVGTATARPLGKVHWSLPANIEEVPQDANIRERCGVMRKFENIRRRKASGRKLPLSQAKPPARKKPRVIWKRTQIVIRNTLLPHGASDAIKFEIIATDLAISVS